MTRALLVPWRVGWIACPILPGSGYGGTPYPRAWRVEDEVEEVLAAPGEDRAGREDSRVAMGRTRAGRYLRVIYAPGTGGDDLFVITAYELRGKPLRAYRRMLKKGKRR